MEVKVTGIPKHVVKALDLQVEQERLKEGELGKLSKLTREAFLRNYFEQEAIAPEIHRKELAYENLIIRLLYFLECNSLEWLQMLAIVDDNWKETITGNTLQGGGA
ncbi:hypothetical protein QJV38_14110 [Listeria cossartiae subsp. cayugensis]|uniref:Uncharacterized protein n=1 Tax=Listeria cossartiae subsp. cayugensis TaxID=2713505 RepID=A0ABU2IRJ5_9LIST|nr:hypothetical protein [Listeria cossartiae]EGY4491816.1 hypothetical protein [Listeria monocytogenes]EHC6322776.1 hypothetical protein [Listeria monocytogenes]MDT0067302.1 hypothetical protein [Listeria cossartiae subsp. cayugensis]MDT0081149.1 hypothetical protein [Listeria cossartiae subsp. cayugensis]MDT0083985.1 hypothetical protein [Listeria cossartiae subsp. cayugensis]